MRQRLATWVSWVAAPWAQLTLIAALVGAAAAPAFLVAAADIWEVSAGDGFTVRLLGEEQPTDVGLSVSIDARYRGGNVENADAAVGARIGQIESLGSTVRTLITYEAPALVGEAGSPSGVPIRILARPGAVESLRVTESLPETEGGVWISEWFATERNIGLGDPILVESAAAPEDPGAEAAPGGGPLGEFRVVGIYETIWAPNERELPEYWSQVPQEFIPRYLGIFREPNFTLVVAEEETLAASGVTGQVQWAADLTTPPASASSLRSLESEYDDIKSDLLSDAEIVSALNQLSDGGGETPTTTSRLTDVLDAVEASIDDLGQPLAATRLAGVVIGVGVMVASGFFLVDRRRFEFRLLAGEGDRWLRFFGRGLAQLFAPFAIGAAAGAVVAPAAALWLGPANRLAFNQVDVAAVAIVVVGGLMAAALTIGFLGQRTLHTGSLGPPRSLGWVAALSTGALLYLWLQVNGVRGGSAADLDLAVVSLPLVALIAAVSLIIVLFEQVVRRWGPSGRNLPGSLYLAWRGVTANDRSAQLIIAALSIGFGLVYFSALLVQNLERVTEVKVASTLGAETNVEVVRDPSDGALLPEGTTVVGLRRTSVEPGGVPVKIVAVDTESLPGAALWPDEFGADLEDVMATLEAEATDSLPIVAVRGQGVPAQGGFASSGTSFSFRVVEYLDGLPLVEASAATVLVSAESLDQWALGRLAAAMALPPDSPQVLEAFRAPTEGFRKLILSQQPLEEIRAFVNRNELVARSELTRTARINSIDVIAPLLAFEYMALLGYVAAVASIAALLLFLESRRRRKALARTLMWRMGFSRAKSAMATAFEVTGLTLVALISAMVAAPVVANRLLAHFEPTPTLPPSTVIEFSIWTLVWLTFLGLAALTIVVWAAEAIAPGDEGRTLRAIG